MREVLNQLSPLQWFVLVEFIIAIFVIGFIVGNWWGDRIADYIITGIKRLKSRIL
jgi:flagellar biosynthesis protein FliQ